MKTKYSILLFFTLLLTLNSCKQSDVEKEIEAFMESYVNLELDSMFYLGNQRTSVFDIRKHKYSYIVYVDSFSCSGCELNHFSDWAALGNYVDINDVTYLFIVSPKKKELTYIIEKVRRDTLFNDRIYIDAVGLFERSNSRLPRNKLLHTFLIDGKGQVVLVGSPINNSKMRKMLLELLEHK